MPSGSSFETASPFASVVSSSTCVPDASYTPYTAPSSLAAPCGSPFPVSASVFFRLIFTFCGTSPLVTPYSNTRVVVSFGTAPSTLWVVPSIK